MSILIKLTKILEESQKSFEEAINRQDIEPLFIKERIDKKPVNKEQNQLVYGDNLSFMRYLLLRGNMKGKVDLIYIDPPFFSKADYKIIIKRASDQIEVVPTIEKVAYKDTWKKGIEEYLKMLCTRLFYMKELLSHEGNIFIHLDWHSVHYVKVLMDEIFGEEHFINEIIWRYKSGGVSKRYFARKHDTILYYSKSKKYFFNPIKEKSYNRGYKPYRFKGVEEFEDDKGWYTLVNMKDVWSLDMVGRTSKERVGYATQKPEALIERIIKACTKEGDICADFFAGSGTLAAVASRLNRQWLICDTGNIACLAAHKRMMQHHVSYDFCSMGKKVEENTYITFKRFDMDAFSNLNIGLEAYGYNDEKDIPVASKYLDTIKMLISKDSLQLIEYWSVDINYDEHIFKPVWSACRTTEGLLETNISIHVSCNNRFAVRILDVFGNETFVVKESKECQNE